MGYKFLGFAVWRLGRWYVARRVSGARGKLAAAGVSAVVVGGVIAAGRARGGGELPQG